MWLTVLAIPVQGFAAARMTHCLAAPASAQQHGSHGPSEALDPPERHDAHARHHQHHPQGHHDHHAVTGDGHAGPDVLSTETVETAAAAAMAVVADADGTADVDATAATPAVSPQDGKVAGIDKKCSACAACCAAAALPTHVAEVPKLDLVSTPTGLVEVTSVSFIASGPERPPRAHLA